jgi:hypothetical protein
VSFLRRLAATYGRIGRTYWAWAPAILLLALVVFVPLGLLDALAGEIEVESLDLDSGIKVAALVAAVALVTTTGLLGEVFFAGAVSISLTHPGHDRPPPLSHIVRRLNYSRLIAVDVIYVGIVVVGLLLVFVPGALAFVFLGLAGPAVELEDRTIRGAFKRSFQLVRGNFWLVFWILVPIEVTGDVLGDALVHLVHNLLGDDFWASWLAEAGSNIVLSPLFAVAAVLLTVELITQRDGLGPRLNSARAHA